MSLFAKPTLIAATTALLALSAVVPVRAQAGGFGDCLQTIGAEATRQGVPAAVIDTAFRGLTPDRKVVDLDARQPEFSQTYGKYVGTAVTPERVSRGRQKLAQYGGLLGQLQAEYGIPPQFKEAVKFAALGFAALNSIANNIPAASHADHYAVMGKIAGSADAMARTPSSARRSMSGFPSRA